MTTKNRLAEGALLPLFASLFALACSSTTDPLGNSGGTTATGGSPGSGGYATGGTPSTGGNSTGGVSATGGISTGGNVATGGTATGGMGPVTGGSATVTGGAPPATGGSSAKGGAGAGAGTGGSAPGTGGSNAGGGNGGNGGSAGAGTGGSAGGPPVGTASTENTGASCVSAAGALKKNPKLPDPFAMRDGTRIASKADWKCRRNEIKKDVEKYEIGPKPEPPTVAATLSGNSLSVKVTTSAGSITLTSNVTAASGSSCVAIGMNGPSSLISGCVQVPFMHDQVVKYGSGSTQSQSDPFYKVYPDLWGKIGNYSAWSWGVSRIIDGLEQVKDQLKIDPTKIGVHGCSYAGKMALFAGAFDERVALTVAQESGGGGITSWRTSQDFTTRTGTNIEKIDNTNYSWFMSSMKSLDPYSLPHDHHELIAMIAPRAVVALGNQDFEWLGDESGWKSINVAKEVWKALGIEDRIGFDFTSNHGHCQAPASQVASVKAFVDKFLKGQAATTSIAIKPQEGNFDLDYAKVIDWTTPMLQ